MKLHSDSIMQHIGDEAVLVPIGAAGERFHGVLRLNSSAAFLLRCLQQETDEAALLSAMEQEYEGTPEQFRRSVDQTLEALRSVGALQE